MKKQINNRLFRRCLAVLLTILLFVNGLTAVYGFLVADFSALTGILPFTAYAVGDGSGGGGGSSILLSMNWSYPANGMSDVGIQPVIQCKYTHNVAQAFENNRGKISLQREDGASVPVIVFVADTQIEFDKRQFLYVTPAESLDYGTKYTLTLHQGIQAKNGMVTGEDQEINFRTIEARSSFSSPSIESPAWMDGMKQDSLAGACTPGIDSVGSGTLTDELSGESVDSLPASVTVQAGCHGEIPAVLQSFTYEELSGFPLIRQVYSCHSESGQKGVLSTIGVRITDILSQCGIGMSNVESISFSSSTGSTVRDFRPYEQERYYFPEYSDGLSSLSPDAGNTSSPVQVDTILTLKDKWGSCSNVPDFFTVSTKGRFRLICGQTAFEMNNLTDSVPWIDTIRVILKEPMGDAADGNGQGDGEGNGTGNTSGEEHDAGSENGSDSGEKSGQEGTNSTDGDGSNGSFDSDSNGGNKVQSAAGSRSVSDPDAQGNRKAASQSESSRQSKAGNSADLQKPANQSGDGITIREITLADGSMDQQSLSGNDSSSEESVSGSGGEIHIYEITPQELPETAMETEDDNELPVMILAVLIAAVTAAGFYRRKRDKSYRLAVQSLLNEMRKLESS